MRKSVGSVVFIFTVFFGGYFFYTALAVCPVPITYKIGELDTRFGLTHEAARLAITEAESIWEDATGRNLFTYDATAEFSINFTYDERHALTQAEEVERVRLDAAAEINGDITAEYTALVKTYDTLQLSYEDRVQAYEKRLARYNTTVASFNEAGGAPAEAYAALKIEDQALESDRVALEAVQLKLSTLVEKINAISERGNQIVERYNSGVLAYNTTFGTEREFTEGTYLSSGRIDIFTYADPTELRLVLAHELGHALSLDHVTGSKSIMYFLIGEQPDTLAMSESDMAEFTLVCGQGSIWDTIQEKLNHIFSNT